MATSTYNLIASQVVGSGGAASVTFSSIPATYTDLKLAWSGRTNLSSVVEGTTVTFNGSNTYSGLYLQSSGSGVSSATQSIVNGGVADAASATSSTFSNCEIYIPNYTGTTQKSISVDSVQENNATAAYAYLGASLCNLTSAITSITITGNASGSWVQYSTFYLYGIKNS